MSTNNWPNNDVNTYVPTKRSLGNKTLFTNIIKNGNTSVRYFSGTDAEIYFGEIYIDEVVQIQFQVQQNTMPLFGYNSYVYDQVARGSRIINGTFTVNFTQANYLYDVLNTLSDQPTATNMSVTKDDESTPEDQEKYYPKAKSKLYMNNPDGPMWDKTFEIILSYGDAKQAKVKKSTMLALTGVVLTGCSQDFGINGEPVYETYTFIARDIASSIATDNTSSTSTTSSESAATKEDSAAITINDITYSEYIDDKTEKPAGIIELSYKSSCPIEEVSMQLPSTLGLEGGMTKMIDNNIVDKNKITYRVPTEWREGIKKYCMNYTINSISTLDPLTLYTKVPDNPTLPSSLNVDMLFEYQANGSSTSKSIKGKLKLKNVLTNM
jgi:hypothetical protein